MVERTGHQENKTSPPASSCGQLEDLEKTEVGSVLQWHFLGEVVYQQAWDWQKSLRQLRIAGTIPDTLLLLEHPPTITLGRLRGEHSLLLPQNSQDPNNLVTPPGIKIIRSDRGGDATLHAPGQLVGYLIVNLRERNFSLPRFVEAVAQVMIDYLQQHHNIRAFYDADYPGVWIEQCKIAAFGFHLHQDVTMHGFAFNLSTDLSLFQWIVPCGLAQKGVTSLAQHVAQPPSCAEVAPLLAQKIAKTLVLRPHHRPELLEHREPWHHKPSH